MERMAPIDILLVEDHPGDVDLMIEALEDAQIANCLHIVNDGEAALSFLHRERGYEQVPQPDLILLDLNLPKKRRARGTGAYQARPSPAAYSGGHPDDLFGR